jgi:epoxyqueuosine reductase
VMRELDSPPYTVDPQVLTRFDQRRTVFERRLTDTEADFYGQSLDKSAVQAISRDLPGYSRVDFARSRAARTVCDHFHGAYSWDKLARTDPVTQHLGTHEKASGTAMSEQIRESARICGADLVGICELDHRWVYSHNGYGDPVEIPSELRYAIVMAMGMDPTAIRTSPAFSASTAVGIGYSRMAFSIACLAEFIRNLGYQAIPMGNDTALSIPIAVDAGLGELGRNGLLITPQFGPCVRLCKVFTNMPLEAGTPIEFGVADTCRRCGKCADACEAGAIQLEPEPSFDGACPSNSQGILRWAVNSDKCYSFWIQNGSGCSTCIAACPFTPVSLPGSGTNASLSE